MSTRVVISAPAVVLSVMMGSTSRTTCLLLGIPTAIYTMFGGVQAVAWTDVKQMYLIVFGLRRGGGPLVVGLPDNVSINEALHIAGTAGRLQVFNFSTDPTVRFTFWTGTIGALFLFLSYFGTDQSQVQRYLTAKSVDEARTSLLMSAYWKIPLQALVMIIGVFMFVFYLFTPPPMLFNPRARSARARERASRRVRGARSSTSTPGGRERGAAAQQLLAAGGAPGDDGGDRGRAGGVPAASEHVKAVRADAIALVKRGVRRRVATTTSTTSSRPTSSRSCRSAWSALLMAAIFAAAMSTIVRRAVGAVHVHGDRLLPALGPRRRRRRAPAEGVEVRDGVLGGVRVDRGDLGGGARLADRSRQPLRIVLLRLDPRRVPAGDRLEARQLHRRLRRADRRDERGRLYVATFTMIAFLWHNLIGAAVVVAVGIVVSALTGGPHKGGSGSAERALAGR